MEKITRIEGMLESQVRHGLVSYYMDSRDKEQRNNEGRLEPVEASELTTAQFVVYFFANSVRENIAKAGIKLPQVKIAVARALPQATSSAYAYRHSVHYDHARRTLYIRDTRLSTIGEFCVVMMHALAHIKAANNSEGTGPWNDADPAFLKEFYGLLECCTEEMFFMRLPSTKASREQVAERDYRPAGIMSASSMGDIEAALKRVSKGERDSFLRTYLQM